MNLVAAREGVDIAIDALRSNRVRAALTILGIVIGVATVVAMAAIIGGVRATVVGQLEAFGPNNFIIDRWDPSQLSFVNDGSQPPPWEGKPAITMQEAEMVAALPTIRSVTPSINAQADLDAGTRSVAAVPVAGYGYMWPDYTNGEFVHGRNFLPTDDQRSASVVVLSAGLAAALFDDRDPTGRGVRLDGHHFVVTGVFKQTENIFTGAQEEWALVPTGAAIRRLGANPDWMTLLIVPSGQVTQARAMDDVTATLRTARGLRPAEENNFALIRQETFLAMFDRITGVFFLVMLVLSSIGLLVGGVGVVAIMMISVTERTREIGVRKALGATRREILWQFLVESMTVTVIGGIIGLILGGGGAMLLRALSAIPATVPLWSVVAAILVSAVSGIGFGIYPANKAARLDPVDALRHE